MNRPSKLPSTVTIVEMGARDGLQNEDNVSTNAKVNLINQLSQTGLSHIEVGSFVSPKWVPQMADSDLVFKGLARNNSISYSALTPNLMGLEKAISCGVNEVAIFASASESFSKANINCSIKESIERIVPLIKLAKRPKNIPIGDTIAIKSANCKTGFSDILLV